MVCMQVMYSSISCAWHAVQCDRDAVSFSNSSPLNVGHIVLYLHVIVRCCRWDALTDQIRGLHQYTSKCCTQPTLLLMYSYY
jgi:hypothetical protein